MTVTVLAAVLFPMLVLFRLRGEIWKNIISKMLARRVFRLDNP
jgi:hypothetical protein